MMKSWKNIRLPIGIIILALVMFGCADEYSPIQNNNTDFRAIAAVAIFASLDSDEYDPCGCYEVFENIDFEQLTDQEIIDFINGIFDNLSIAQQNYLFDPVCDDSSDFIFESACIADCYNANYHSCTDEELDDFFFGDIGIGENDWEEFPFTIELPDGTIIEINSDEEFFTILDQWYSENDDWYDDYYSDSLIIDTGNFFIDCIDYVYPISIFISVPDSTIETANNLDEYFTIFENWFFENEEILNSLEEEDFPFVVTPYQIEVLETNEFIEINSDDDFFEALDENCE